MGLHELRVGYYESIMARRSQHISPTMRRSFFCSVICCVLLFQQGLYAQTDPKLGPKPLTDPRIGPKLPTLTDPGTRTADINRRIAERIAGLAPAFPPMPRRLSNRDLVLRNEIEKALTIELKQAYVYGSFLDQDGTGLFRLLPADRCISGKKLLRGECTVQKSLIVFWGNGYSLRGRKHIDVNYADFNLSDGKIEAKSTMVQTILTHLGPKDISSLDLDSPGIKFLSEFVPQTDVLKAREQFADFTKGYSEESGPDSAGKKFVYSKSVPVKLGDVYAVRSIFYNSEMYLLPEFDKAYREHNLDIIAVFKIVEVDQNGAVTFLWRELSSKDAPFFSLSEPK